MIDLQMKFISCVFQKPEYAIEIKPVHFETQSKRKERWGNYIVYIFRRYKWLVYYAKRDRQILLI